MPDRFLSKKVKGIKLVATDIDGVWTDGRMYYSANGDSMKAFSTYDGMGVALLRESGIETAIITSEESKTVQKRAEKLNIKYCFQGEKNKLSRLKQLCKTVNLSLENIAYIGDDVNDMDVLRSVGFSAMPLNSPILHRFTPDFVTTRQGGNGAFREFADLILSLK